MLRCGAAPCPLLVDPGGALLRENAPHSPPLAVREHRGAAPRAHPSAPSPSRPQGYPGAEERKKTAHESAEATAWRDGVRRGWEG